jgi:hypothetical protein
VLLVLDQFEQWLHAHGGDESSPLVDGLRHCEGGHVQCILMVRDDFWMAATRFMRALEIRIVEGVNSNAVDLFPLRHAVNVLTAFGRAYGALSEIPSVPTPEQAAFIEKAVTGLAQDNKVMCVRLALFAEMMKSRPWISFSLAPGCRRCINPAKTGR